MSAQHEDELQEEEQIEESAAGSEAEAAEAAAGEAAESEEESVELWKDRALRAQAEMANMRRRLDSEVEQRTRRRLEALLHDLIMVGDHIELALGSIPEPVRAAQGADGFLMGMDAIRTAFEGVLRQHGLELIDPSTDADFDPALHEAVQTDSEDGLEAARLEVLRRGYKIGAHVLRPAQVRVIQPA
ncbi:MAG: nucleotide exchange factor GrpE [Planctomycetes bacterium]|nr:nucleotide exchange factor GrpE [Planctomycetota bacterium]